MTRTHRAKYVLASAIGGLSLAAGLVMAGPAGAASSSVPTATVTETGSTLLYPLMNIWAPAFNQKYPQVTIQTAGTGSGTGISDASNGTADLGASDAYLSPSEVSATPDLLNIPLAISAQDIVYDVPGITAHLKLTGKVLSEIYQGTITNWNNSAIAALNPGVTLPNLTIVTLHRSDSSGDTFLFSQFLSKTDPSGWGAKVGYNTTVSWPNAPGALAEDGNSGMVSGCKATPGCVAYIGISYQTQVLQDGLNYASLQNGKGQYELPTAATIEAQAAGYTAKTPANGTISLIYGKVANGYPIVNYEYGIVSTHQSDSSTAKALDAFLVWAVTLTDGNSAQYLDQVNFQPLPKKVEAQSITQIKKIT